MAAKLPDATTIPDEKITEESYKEVCDTLKKAEELRIKCRDSYLEKLDTKSELYKSGKFFTEDQLKKLQDLKDKISYLSKLKIDIKYLLDEKKKHKEEPKKVPNTDPDAVERSSLLSKP